MIDSKPVYLVLIVAGLFILFIALVPGVLREGSINAQDAPVAETPTTVPPDTPTATTVPSTPTLAATATTPPEATPTDTLPPATEEPPATPAPPVPIPEPITVVLFGTGLAALSAAAASRRKNQE